MAENEKKQPTVKIGMKWDVLRPDARQYKQQSLELRPDTVHVAVTIPLTAEYIDNATGILSFQVANASSKEDVHEPLPILTPIGLVYAMKQIEDLLTDKDQVSVGMDVTWEEDEKADPPSDDEDWDDEDSPVETKADDEDDKNWEDEWE